MSADKVVLGINNLSVEFQLPESLVHAVNNISFELYAGKTLALVGESGSGKSVTAHSIMRLLPATANIRTGQVLYREQDLLGLDDKRLNKVRGDKIGMIFQEPMTALNPLHSIEKQIGEVLVLHKKMSKLAAKQKVLSLLNKVKIRDPEKRLQSYPHQLSGGQRQRVMIAMALANEPDILIADEPTTALDVTVQAEILQLLEELQRDMGMAILLISHDLGVVRKIADIVCVMHNGSIVESGSSEQIFNSPQHEYTRHLIDSEPSGVAKPITADTETIISADQIKVWYPLSIGIFGQVREYVKAVDDISLSVRCGETLGIVGESGSGKTTLAMAILRLLKSQGTITYKNKNLNKVKGRALRDLRKDLQVVFQDPFGSLSPRLTIEQIIGEGLDAHRLVKGKKELEDSVVEIMQEVGLDPARRHSYPHEFSGGQRQRIAIARAIVLKPKVLVLDEPTSALDRSVQSQVIDLLRYLQEKHDIAYIFISHDLKVIRAMANRILVMKSGQVVESGETEEIFNNPQQEYTRKLIAAAFNIVLG